MTDIITSIKNYDLDLLQKSTSPEIVNEKIFKIFPDDSKPLWTPLIKVSTLKKDREDKKRYDGITIKKNEDADCKLAQILIDNGANINDKDRNGNTALHYCIYYKNYKLMELLVNNGADVNVQDNNGSTPLHLAIKKNYANGRHNEDYYTKFLIDNKADRYIKDNNGESYVSLLFGVDNNYR